MIDQTTLHNILTCVVAVILFIFQTLNYLIAWIKKYVEHGQKTTTVVAADTTISSDSISNDNNLPENAITVQGLIQKHFDIPLIIAEDAPKVDDSIQRAKLLTSNDIRKEKKKIDQFMDHLVDNSYVARGLGLIAATVGRQAEFYLYSKYDNNFENVVIKLKGRHGEIGQIIIFEQKPTNCIETKSIPIDYFYDEDRIRVTYTPFAEGVYTLTLIRNGISICRSPYYISVEKSPTNSRSQIRLGTKKYKMVTKFGKSKTSAIETSNNDTPATETSRQSISRNILPASDGNSIRTDVMSIVTKFESKSINVQKNIHKRLHNITEKCPETDLIDEISTFSNNHPKIGTDNKNHGTNENAFKLLSIQTKPKPMDKTCWNDVNIVYANSMANDIITIDTESDRIKNTNLEESIGITNSVPQEINVSSTCLKSISSVLFNESKKESLNNEDSYAKEKSNQTYKTTELLAEKNHGEMIMDPVTIIDKSEIKCIDNELSSQNEVSCFDDDDRKTVMDNVNDMEMESNLNNLVTQQITNSAQYNINTPFSSIITKITNSICERCSIKVIRILSDFPREINITHNNNSNEIRSSFETLLAQPISININIDSLLENPISDTNEYKSSHLLKKSPNEIKLIDNVLYDEINYTSPELMTKENKHDNEVSKTVKDKITDHITNPSTEHKTNIHKIVHMENELSKNRENILQTSKFKNNSIHKSENKMVIQAQNVHKSSEHNMAFIKTNQFHDNIGNKLNTINKESDKTLDTSVLVAISNAKNAEELVTNELKIFPDENTNSESCVINNIVLRSDKVTLSSPESKIDDNAKTNNLSCKNDGLTFIEDENQKLMIEKLIEPILNNFKNKIVEKIIQLHSKNEVSNTDYTLIFETNNNNLTNYLQEIQLNNNTYNTERNTENVEILTSQLKNHIDKNEISETILDKEKIDNNHFFKHVENIIKTNLNPSKIFAQTLDKKKLERAVNIAINNSTGQKLDNDLKTMIKEIETQDVDLKLTNNGKIEQDMQSKLSETLDVTQIEDTYELKSSKNEPTSVETQSKISLLNDLDTEEVENTNILKQEMPKSNTMKIKYLKKFQIPTLEIQKRNASVLVTIQNTQEIESIVAILESNIPEETDVLENIDETNESKLPSSQFNDNIIINMPNIIENENNTVTVENITLNSTSNNISTQKTKKQDIETPDLNKTCNAKDVIVERETRFKLPSLNITEIDGIEKPEIIIPNLNAQLSKNATEVTIEINSSSDTQLSNSMITISIPSKISVIENKSFNSKLTLIKTLNKFDVLEILTVPKDSELCDPKKITGEENNTSESILLNSPNNVLEYLKKSEKIPSEPSTLNNTSSSIKLESKNGKDTLHKTLNLQYNKPTLKSIGNEINCNMTINETPIEIDSLTAAMEEQNIEIETLPLIHASCEPEIKLENMHIGIKSNGTKTTKRIELSTEFLEGRTTVEYLTKKNKIPINSSDIIKVETVDDSTSVVEKPKEKQHILKTESSILIDSSAASKLDSNKIVINNEKETSSQIDTFKGSVYIQTGGEMFNEIENIRLIDTSTVSKEEEINILRNETPKTIESSSVVVKKRIKSNVGTKYKTVLPLPTFNRSLEENINEEQEDIQCETTTLFKSFKRLEVEPKVLETVPQIPNNNNQNMIENVTKNTNTTPINSCASIVDEKIKNLEKVTKNKIATPIDYSDVVTKEEIKIKNNTKNESLLLIDKSMIFIEAQIKLEEANENESATINSSAKTKKKTNDNETESSIPTDTKTTSEEKQKIEKYDTSNEKTTDIAPSSKIIQKPTGTEKVTTIQTSKPIHYSDTIIQEQQKIDIQIEKKMLLQKETSTESIKRPKLEEHNAVTKTEELTCIDSLTNFADKQRAMDNVTTLNNDTENEIISPLETLNASDEEQTVIKLEVENKNKTSINIVDKTLLPNDTSTAASNKQTVVDNIPANKNEKPVDSSAIMVKETTNEDIEIEKTKFILIETSIPSVKVPKLVEYKNETEGITYINCITVFSGKSTGMDNTITPNIDIENETSKKVKNNTENKTPTLIDSSSVRVEDPKKVIIETVTETLLQIDTSIVSIEEQKLMEYGYKKNTEKPINSLTTIVKDRTKLGIETEEGKCLTFESSTVTVEEPNKVENITETERINYTDSLTVITDETKGINNVTTNIDKENETSLPIVASTEIVENLVEKEKIVSNASSTLDNSSTVHEVESKETLTETATRLPIATLTASIDEEIQVEHSDENKVTTPIDHSAELMEISAKVIIDAITETLLPVETYTASLEINKIVVDVSKSDYGNPIDSSSSVVKRQTNVDIETEMEILHVAHNCSENDTMTPMICSPKLVDEQTRIITDAKTETLLPVETSSASTEKQKLIDCVSENNRKTAIDSSAIIVKEETQLDTEAKTNLSLAMGTSSALAAEQVLHKLPENVILTQPESSPVLVEKRTKYEDNLVLNDTEIEILSPIDRSTISAEEQKVVDNVSALSIKEPIAGNAPKNVTATPIDSVNENVEDRKVVDIETKVDTLLLNDTSTKSVDEQIVLNYININGHRVSINSSSIIENDQRNLDIESKNNTLLVLMETCTTPIEEQQPVEYKSKINQKKPIDSSLTIVKEQTKLGIENEEGKCLTFESSTVTVEEPNKVENITETERINYTDSLTVITDETKGINNVTTNIDKENETSLPIVTSTEIVENLVEKEKIVSNASSTLHNSSTVHEVESKETLTETATRLPIATLTASIDEEIQVEHSDENKVTTPIDHSAELMEISAKVIIDGITETLLPVETYSASLEINKIVVDVSKSDYGNPIDSSSSVVKRQTNVDIETEMEILHVAHNCSENDTMTPMNCSPKLVDEQTRIITDAKTETLLPIETSSASTEKQKLIDCVSENNRKTAIDSSAIIVKEETQLDTEAKTNLSLAMGTSSALAAEQVVHKLPENVILTQPESSPVLVEKRTKYEDNLIGIEISTLSAEERILVKNLSEYEHPIQTDYLATIVIDQSKIDINTENEIILPMDITTTRKLDVIEQTNVEIVSKNETLTSVNCFNVMTTEKTVDIGTENETLLPIEISTASIEKQNVVEYVAEYENTIPIDFTGSVVRGQKEGNLHTKNTVTAYVEEEVQVKEVNEYKCTILTNSTDAFYIESKRLDTDTETEQQLTKNETHITIDLSSAIVEGQNIDQKNVTNSDTFIESVEEQVKIETFTERETTTLIPSVAVSETLSNEIEEDSKNDTSTLIDNSATIAVKQTEVQTKKTPQNIDDMFRNTKTISNGGENKTEKSDNPNYYSKYGETSKILNLDNEDNLQRISYGIQKLEMSVQRMKTFKDDNYEKSFVQLGQTEKCCLTKDNVDEEIKTIVDDKLYTVNESDLNAILCASSLEEALTLLDSKIKFKFKHRKSSRKINSAAYIPNIQTSDSGSSDINTNFTEAQEFFKEIEKKSKK